MTRKSKREIERKLEELEPDLSDEYPVIDNLSVLLSYDWETVDVEENLYRREETGEVYYADPDFMEQVAEVFEE